MNRLRIMDLPGIERRGIILPEDVRGKIAYELVSTEAVMDLVGQYRDPLKLALEERSAHWTVLLGDCLISDDEDVQAEAADLARRLGHRMAFILLTLKRGDAANREARPEMDGDTWAHWASIDQVWLGGGLASGQLGQMLYGYAVELLYRSDIGPFNLRLSPYGATLPLVGTARQARIDYGSALIMDFGSTRVKRAIAVYSGRALVGMHHLAMLPATPPTHLEANGTPGDEKAIGAATLEHIINCIVGSLEEAQGVDSTVLVSIAVYLTDGHPQDYQRGQYSALRLVTDNLQEALSDAVSRRLDRPIHIQLFHDGTAAAATYAGSPRTAVITLGTALGIGFPPASDQHLCKLHIRLE
ncbi:MAG: hypothetical protein IPK19_12695 [Chloroflexi bacterium]|nr:hypothetical protein [Chloroflexota bacterium]